MALECRFKTGRGPHLGGFRLFLPASKPLAYVIATMVTSFFAGGMLRMASNQVRGLTPQIEDLFNVTDCWFDLLLFGFLASVLIRAWHIRLRDSGLHRPWPSHARNPAGGRRPAAAMAR